MDTTHAEITPAPTHSVLGIFLSFLIPVVVLLSMLFGASHYVTYVDNHTVTPKIARPVTITGELHSNGYIPAGSTITIFAKAQTDQEYQAVVTGLSPVDGTTWTWSNAQIGTTYAIHAALAQKESVLTQSTDASVIGPAQHVPLTLNAVISPETFSFAAIAGTMHIVGAIPDGSTVDISVRPLLTSQTILVIRGMLVTDGSSWSWTGAHTGAGYEVRAYMQVHGVTVAASSIATVAAPATNVVLTLQPSGKNK